MKNQKEIKNNNYNNSKYNRLVIIKSHVLLNIDY